VSGIARQDGNLNQPQVSTPVQECFFGPRVPDQLRAAITADQRDDLREVHIAIEFEKLFKSLAASLFDLEAFGAREK
jgi:hypothetical protein